MGMEGRKGGSNAIWKAGMKARTGKSAKDIFAVTTEASTGRDQTPASETKHGRPAVHDEEWTKVTVVLFNRQIAFLDRLAIDLRLMNGWAVSRAEIIRALIGAAADSGIELEDVRSELELRELLATRLSH